MNLITNSPRLMLTLSLLLLAISVTFWIWYLRAPTGPTHKWAYDLTTGTLFRVPLTAVPPFDAPSGADQGVDALVLRYPSGESKPVMLRSNTPEAAALTRQLIDPTAPLKDMSAMYTQIMQGHLVREVSGSTWVAEGSPTGSAIISAVGAQQQLPGVVFDLPR